MTLDQVNRLNEVVREIEKTEPELAEQISDSYFWPALEAVADAEQNQIPLFV